MTELPSIRVITAVADAKGCEPTELPPLEGAIDSEALDALMGSTDATHSRYGSKCKIRFSYADLSVSVIRDGTVRIDVSDGRPD